MTSRFVDRSNRVRVDSLRQATSAEVDREIADEHGNEEISDAAALAIAAWWQGPTRPGRVLAELASTGGADVEDLLEDIRATRIEALGSGTLTEREFVQLDFLVHAAAARLGMLKRDHMGDQPPVTRTRGVSDMTSITAYGRTYTGRTAESIARRVYGRTAVVRYSPDPNNRWGGARGAMITRTDRYGTHVLAQVVILNPSEEE